MSEGMCWAFPNFYAKINVHNENINVHNIFSHKLHKNGIIEKIFGGEKCEELL